ncbi:MAG: hypothetical protein HZB42_14015 [Sphingobacteriales bacterium]|nr:hypothetical protein [Sphingobacteriales bacterium]
MYAELYQYLLLHNKLSVPGIGTFLLNRKPAESDFLNKQIKPPSFSISFEQFTDSPGTGFYKWLGNVLGITDRDAVIRFNDFVFETKRQISNGNIINWNGVGSLTKGLGDEVKFSPATIITAEQPETAEKVIREKAEHMVRVGEDEKTSVEMSEILNRPVKKRSYWWVLPLIIGVLAAAFIGWHVAEHGFDVSGMGNKSKLCPSEALP